MLDDDELLRALLEETQIPPSPLLVGAAASDSVPLLVTAAVLADSAGTLGAARRRAITTRDRQLVALAEAHLSGDSELFDAQVRDHLVDFPDSLVASWLARLRGRGRQGEP